MQIKQGFEVHEPPTPAEEVWLEYMRIRGAVTEACVDGEHMTPFEFGETLLGRPSVQPMNRLQNGGINFMVEAHVGGFRLRFFGGDTTEHITKVVKAAIVGWKAFDAAAEASGINLI